MASRDGPILSAMPATLVFAAVAGLLTILSPCVLPVVPLLVGATTDPAGPERGRSGGGRRVAGVILGFGTVFVATTVVLASTLAALGITTTALRTLAALVLVAFGATLVVPALGRTVERWAARMQPARATAPGGGFTGGLALGAMIGLVWSPCVGPIMATVIAAAVVDGPTVGLVAVATAYVVGAAVPLALVAVAGRRAVERLGSGRARERLVRGFGAVAMAAGLLIVTGLDIPLQTAVASVLPGGSRAEVTAAQPGASAEAGVPAGLAAPMRNVDGRLLPDPYVEALPASVELEDLGPAPELAGITAWINSEPLTVASLRGKVVLVHFWTFGCINCVHVQPYVKAWDERYASDGLVVLGVHTPELSYERDLANVRDAVDRQGVRFPVAFDPEFASWRAYDNRYWPAFYFIDRQGRIRRADAGEGSYGIREQVIRALLAGA